MDKTFRIVLFGHRDFDGHKKVEERLYELMKKIIKEKEYVEIYIGRNGEFDIYAASVIKRMQKNVGKENNELVCVLPYKEKDMIYYAEYYDKVMIPESVEKIYPKAAITKRNRWMVECCDLFICYIEREVGGAYTAFKYAQKLEKTIINLAE